MAIPSYDFMIPQPDDFMDYDYDVHQYIPKIEALSEGAYLDLITMWGNEENAQSYLDLLRKVVYDVILSYKDGTKYQTLMLYYLSHSKEAREWLWQLFIDTAWYNFRDGGFMLAYNSGANINLGKEIKFEIESALSPIARQKITNDEFGSRILKYNINDFSRFDTLDDLLDYLVVQTLITSEQRALITDISEIPKSYQYKTFLNHKGKYVFEDLLTYDKIVAEMKLYNNVSGNW